MTNLVKFPKNKIRREPYTFEDILEMDGNYTNEHHITAELIFCGMQVVVEFHHGTDKYKYYVRGVGDDYDPPDEHKLHDDAGFSLAYAIDNCIFDFYDTHEFDGRYEHTDY